MAIWRELSSPVLLAHRGAAADFPENSIEAFEAAIAAGADVLEADVHMTSDGHVVVAHDASGARLCGVPREIRNAALADVKRWDLTANSPRSRRGAPVRVPTLAEVLRAFPDTPFNLDVKQSEPDMTGTLVNLIRRHQAEARVLLTSFDVAITRRLRALGYAGPLGLSRAEVAALVLLPAQVGRLAFRGAERMQIPTRSGPLALDRTALITKAHRLGLSVDYWVVNEPSAAEQLLASGADGIVTDQPLAIAQVFSRMPQAAAWRERHPDCVQR